jgi:hypothetical protein
MKDTIAPTYGRCSQDSTVADAHRILPHAMSEAIRGKSPDQLSPYEGCCGVSVMPSASPPASMRWRGPGRPTGSELCLRMGHAFVRHYRRVPDGIQPETRSAGACTSGRAQGRRTRLIRSSRLSSPCPLSVVPQRDPGLPNGRGARPREDTKKEHLSRQPIRSH